MKDEKIRRKCSYYKSQRKKHPGITDAELRTNYAAKLAKEQAELDAIELKKLEEAEAKKKAKQDAEMAASKAKEVEVAAAEVVKAAEVVVPAAEPVATVVPDPVVVGAAAIAETLAPNKSV